MNRLVKVALFSFMGIVLCSHAPLALAETTQEIRLSNFNELGAVLLEGREDIRTQVMLHDGSMTFTSCNGVTNTVRDRLVSHINTDFLYYDFRIGCESSGLFSVRFTYELMVEPKTPEDQPFADDWIAKHNGIEIGGRAAVFYLAASVNSKVTLISGMVPAVGRGPLRVVHQKEAVHEFINYGESQVFVGKVSGDIKRAEIDGVFDAVHRVFGTDGLGEYPDVLPRVNYVRATALPIFNWENGTYRKAWYYLFYDHDCRTSPNGMCM